MASCNYCGKAITRKDGELQVFASGENAGDYCSIDCWIKASRKAIKFFVRSLNPNKCGKCAYIEKWECGSKSFFIVIGGNQRKPKTDY